MKSNARIVSIESALLLEKSYWDAMPPKDRKEILKLLQSGESPESIKEKAYWDINPNSMSFNKRLNAAEKYFMAANYAKTNNLHLN